MDRTERVFVYGTLRDPARLGKVLGPGCRFRAVGGGSVAGRLYDLGPWPGLRPARRRGERVRGVLLEVWPGERALRALDRFEEVGAGVYRRRRVRVEVDRGGRLRAWVYEYAAPVRGRPRIPLWPFPQPVAGRFRPEAPKPR